MKLIASVIMRNEMSRYLDPFIGHLFEFCDEIRVLDDNSDDGTAEVLADHEGIEVLTPEEGHSIFYQHEGSARQRLFEWTMLGEPTHILAIDADEFVSDGPMVRRMLEEDEDQPGWMLEMVEVWSANNDELFIRTDGGWNPHQISCLYHAPDTGDRRFRMGQWRIADRPLACGREPMYVRRLSQKTVGVDILHFGWTNVETRQKRYDRYAEHDGGRYHRNEHLESILWTDSRVKTQWGYWPEALNTYKPAILKRILNADSELV